MDALERIAVALEGILACLQDQAPAPRPPKASRPKTPTSTYCKAFEEWWGVYPRREGKAAASKAWIAAGKRIKAARGWTNEQVAAFLLAKAADFAQSPKGMSGQYCPHATTWLNQGRYDDDPACWLRDGNDKRPVIQEGPAEGLPNYAS